MSTEIYLQAIKGYVKVNKNRFLDELVDFLKIPSVACLAEYKNSTIEAAKFLKKTLLDAGADRSILIPTSGSPLVYAEKIIDNSLPTVLFYGHYDVQPADPYSLWNSDPFVPKIINSKIYARGASDDKGQVYLNIKAFEAMNASKCLPCNIKFIIEGEEESGSTSLATFLNTQEAKQLLKADVVLVSDTAMISPEHPSINVSLRGIVTLDI
jgi:acetylornithine deacetylase/succinyl-diaminopimelate desuccinylase-like protein